MVDDFSGWCELVPTKSVTSEIIGAGTWVQYFGRYGAPVVVRSDQDSTFVSKLVDGFYAATGIQPNRTIPHHPSGCRSTLCQAGVMSSLRAKGSSTPQ